MDVEKSAQLTHSKHHQSVVIVRNKAKNPATVRCSEGTGFIIRSTSNSCLVMTCYHVIECSDPSIQTLWIRFPGQTSEHAAEILHHNDEADLAIIIVRGTHREYPALRFGNAEDIRPETNVFLLGYIFMTGTQGTVLCLEPAVSPGHTRYVPLYQYVH